MKAVIQRVSQAEVRIDGESVGRIGRGFLVLLGVAKGDGEKERQWMVDKICHLRVFPNDSGKFDRSLLDIQGEVLIVSQFTLFGDCRKGRRPGFDAAAHPETAETIYEQVINDFKQKGVITQSGRFGAMMDVDLVNEGPVTLILETPNAS
ncbi:MAG: D-tyrosyl-tRNA(Tyr) deacylase [Candidatus Omnitrophica bacterium]|nr:D-tyrosyl-tRNA(Tyr) deacylase [Candidatus Omnitrophota bacterium]